jgi:negative regulator of replication initiation
MQLLKAQSAGLGLSSRVKSVNRRVVVKAVDTETPTPATQATTNATDSINKLPQPDWLPKEVQPVLDFLNATDFDIKKTRFYQDNLQQYLENKYVVESTGWKELPESINGRAAMLGFVAGASAELLGAGPLLLQLSKSPQPVLVVLALITAGSIIPIVKGTEGGYLKSLRETYTIPEGVFTEPNERVHGRLAMVGVGAMILVELLKGSALL